VMLCLSGYGRGAGQLLGAVEVRCVDYLRTTQCYPVVGSGWPEAEARRGGALDMSGGGPCLLRP